MRSKEFWSGVRIIAPLMLGVVPFALVYGVVVSNALIPAMAGWAMSQIIFAGAAQLIAARLFGEGAPILTIIITAAILNLRHVLYSASIAPHLQHLNLRWKLLLGYLLTDEAYAVAITYYTDPKAPVSAISAAQRHWYYFGAALTLWVCWNIATGVGVFIGGQIPASWGLDFSVPLTFIALVFPALRKPADWTAAMVAGIVAVLAYAMPLKLGLITATLLGIVAGIIVDTIMQPSTTKEATTS